MATYAKSGVNFKAAVMMRRRRRRKNEAELHITSTREYNRRAATLVNVWIWFKQLMWQKQLAFIDYYNDK
ncbi:hypothetical protein SUGI_0604750 [Cryptomeria japonica]|nr:hypothetical protein SUGI_0604750 [Cryptomeria japonica]